jgi:MFS transporter, FHS family, glucose/mannose:H+ symporter
MNRRTELTLLAGIVVTGVATAILGAALPLLQLRYGVSEALLGRLFAAQFAGSACAAAISLRHPRFSIVAGFQLIAAGLAAAATASWPYAIAAVLLYGVGLGLVLPSANIAVALAREHTRGASLSILNLVWGLGAAATPLFILAVGNGHRLSSIYFLTAGFSEVISILLWLSFKNAPQSSTAAVPSREHFDFNIFLHGFGFFLYIGAESCVGGWTSEFVFRTFTAPRFATFAIGAFWAGLLVIRASAPAILRRVPEPRLLSIEIVTALSGVLLIVTAPSPMVAAFGAALSGIGMATVFGLQVSNATTYAQRQNAKVPGWLFTCASIGGVTMPWAFGEIAHRASMRVGFILPIASLLILLALTARTTAPRPQFVG